MTITILGNTPSKKNQKQIIYVRGRPVIIPSKRHKEWHRQALPQLSKYRPIQRQIERIVIVLYPLDKRLFDLSNRTESLMDLLVDGKIIADDNYSVVPQLTTKFGAIDKANPRAEIEVFEAD